jgi:hypothetical protein
MKIKTKLVLAIVFLFVEFLIVSLFSLYFIFKISQQNNLITKDNNLSIGYSENMLQSIDKINYQVIHIDHTVQGNTIGHNQLIIRGMSIGCFVILSILLIDTQR